MAKNHNFKHKFKKTVAGIAAGAVIFGSGAAVNAAVHKHNENKVPKEKEYTVQSGDTLYDISNRYYGTGIYFDDIAEYNDIEDPSQIKAGDTIKLPGKVSDDVHLNTVQTYVVQAGDNLTTICEKFYHDTSYETIENLAHYNGIEDMNLIKQGQEIRLPMYEDLQQVSTRNR